MGWVHFSGSLIFAVPLAYYLGMDGVTQPYSKVWFWYWPSAGPFISSRISWLLPMLQSSKSKKKGTSLNVEIILYFCLHAVPLGQTHAKPRVNVEQTIK